MFIRICSTRERKYSENDLHLIVLTIVYDPDDLISPEMLPPSSGPHGTVVRSFFVRKLYI